MLGIPSLSISLAYLLCIVSAIVCVVYGIAKWNSGAPEEPQTPQDQKWVEEEKAVEETL